MSQNRIEIAARLCQVEVVEGHRSGRRYELTPVALIGPDPAIISEIVAVCNEPHIYGWLFASRLGGRAYSQGDAEHFLDWAGVGWSHGDHFVYVLLDEAGAVAGAIDIKSPDLDSAEIGYWLSAAHSGAMTNAVAAVCSLARDAGFAALHALVNPQNIRSSAVLTRAGFAYTGDVERNDISMRRFERRLES